VRDGDIIRLDSYAGTLEVKVDAATLQQRATPAPDLQRNAHGVGRELFATFRAVAGDAEAGAISCM
jgi:phosphogluconate dehydratase